MRIQHNIMAMNAYRNYTNNVSAMKSNLEKLSSGYKINRAGDDAAGLAISEKMRAQITGLETAQKNAKDGISLVQTAEGALTEVHDMLNRMVELATQSANGTYDDTTDRNQMQKELDQLRTEINRIADSSNFNGIKLLDGSMGMNQDAFKLDGFTQAETGLVVSSALSWSALKTGALTGVANRNANTILHKTGNPAQKGSFTLDLSQIKVTTKSAVAATKAIQVKINGVAVTLSALTATGAGKVFTGSDIAKALEDKYTGADKNHSLFVSKTGTLAKVATTGTAAAGGLIYKATDNGDGTVTFETVKYINATGALAALSEGIPNSLVNTGALKSPNWSVALSASATKMTIGDGKGVNTQNIKTTDIKGPSAGTPDQLASTVVTLDPSKIKDGSKIVIGDTTYTFALGKASGFKDADNVIDLTSGPFANIKSLGDITAAADKLQAASIITDAMGDNANFTVGNSGTTTAGDVWKFSVFEKGDGTGKSGATKDIQDKLATEAGFKDLVKVIDPDTPAATKLTVTDSKIKDGNVITIAAGDVEKKYGFDDKKAGTTENGVTWLAKTGGKAALKNALENDGFKVTVDDKGNWELSSSKGMVSVLGKGLTLQIGDTADDYNKLSVTIKDTHCNSLGIDATNMSIADQDSAGLAVDKIKAAINYISDIRGTLGATQNRLDHTINNLSVMTENIQDAESTIRDVDVAEEMMAYTKNNILIQSAQAMLAQANQVPQGVLQLLQ